MKEQLIQLAKQKGFVSPVIGNSVISEYSNKPFYYLWLCELQKWLREKCSLFVTICFDENTVNTYFYYKINSRNGYISNESSHTFKIYEEALKAGLFEALKLIK